MRTNRLIDDFKKQTMDTVWKHLDAMATNYAVYSTHLNGLFPFLKDYDVYLYCTDSNVVVVCLDCCGHNEEQTYEESESLSSLIFAEGCEPRVSVVWKLAEAVRHIKICLQSTNPSINVHGVLLTEANILNSYELSKLWNAHNVTVIDYLKRLKYKKIRVNNIENDDLACKDYVRIIIDASIEAAVLEEFKDLINRNDEEPFDSVLVEEKPESDSEHSEEEYETETKNEEISFTDPREELERIYIQYAAHCIKQHSWHCVTTGSKDPQTSV